MKLSDSNFSHRKRDKRMIYVWPEDSGASSSALPVFDMAVII